MADIKRERITVICGNCEREWDADEHDPCDPCPECGYHDNGEGENIIRLDCSARPGTSATVVNGEE